MEPSGQRGSEIAHNAIGCSLHFEKPYGEANMVLRGQVAIITGASSGIGRATAETMAREGARVTVNYCKNRAGAEEAVEKILC